MYGLDPAGGVVHHHGRHEEVVGEDVVVVVLVVEHHSDAAGPLDLEALLDAAVAAATAQDDLAPDLGRVEGAREAEVGSGCHRPWRASTKGALRGALRDRPADVGATVAQRDDALVEGRVGRWRRRAVTHGTSAGPPMVSAPGPLLPAEIADEDARVGGEQERDRVGADGLGAAADRVVDDVDAVGDRLVDGGGEVGGVAAAVAERLVGDDLGVAGRCRRPCPCRPRRCWPSRPRCRRRWRPCACRGRRCRGRSRTRRAPARVGPVGVDELARADQLVVAGEGLVVGVAAPCCRSRRQTAPWSRGRVRPGGCRVGEAGVLGPDAAVDHTDEDALPVMPSA